MEGWIKIHRKIQECFLWDDKPYDKARAWIDLLLSAMHSDKKMMINGRVVIIKQGSFMTSILKLSDKWGWSRKKTNAFIKMLENENMVTTERTTQGTTITIVNYKKYQIEGTTKGTSQYTTEEIMEEATEETTEETQNKNIKNDKKEKKNIYGAYKHVRLKSSEREELVGSYGKEMTDKCITFLDEYIEMKGYKAKSHYLCIKKWVVDAVKERDRKKGSTKNQFNNYQQGTSDQTVSEFEDLFMREANGG